MTGLEYLATTKWTIESLIEAASLDLKEIDRSPTPEALDSLRRIASALAYFAAREPEHCTKIRVRLSNAIMATRLKPSEDLGQQAAARIDGLLSDVGAIRSAHEQVKDFST